MPHAPDSIAALHAVSAATVSTVLLKTVLRIMA